MGWTRAESPGGLQRLQYARRAPFREAGIPESLPESLPDSRFPASNLPPPPRGRAGRISSDHSIAVAARGPGRHPCGLTTAGTPPKLLQTGRPRRVIRVTKTIVCYRIILPLSSRP
ncbi:hypothetical protein BCEP4_2470003 [Burkholderia cepacia]|nr:hypothetical protein BCEP4_2470003 [Burkholderia cepacia]